VSSPIAGEEAMIVQGPKADGDTDGSYAALQLLSGSATNPDGAQGSLVFTDSVTGIITVLYFGGFGVQAYGLITAVHPGDNANTPETWQSPGLGSGWTSGPSGGAGQGIQYRLEGNGLVHVLGSLHQSSAGAGTTIWTMPSGYVPATGQNIPCVQNSAGTPAANWINVGTGGAVVIGVLPGNGHDVYIDGYYRLN
jgi:hypothetical protein